VDEDLRACKHCANASLLWTAENIHLISKHSKSNDGSQRALVSESFSLKWELELVPKLTLLKLHPS
jgi:hypothetical protein